MKMNVLTLLAACPLALAACSADNQNVKTETATRALTGTLDTATLGGLSRIIAIDTREGAYDATVDPNGAFTVEVPVGRSVVMYVLDETLTPVREVHFDAGGGARTSVLPVAGAPAGAADDTAVSLGRVHGVEGVDDEADCEDNPLEDVDSDDDGIDDLEDSDDDGDDIEDAADDDDDGDEIDDDAEFDAVAADEDDADLDGVEDDADENDDDGPGAGRGRRGHHEDNDDGEDDDDGEDGDDEDDDENRGEEVQPEEGDDDENRGEEVQPEEGDDDENRGEEVDEEGAEDEDPASPEDADEPGESDDPASPEDADEDEPADA
ncbi:MAG: hypothetical protein ACOYM9_05800 [Bradymonadia bacterium]